MCHDIKHLFEPKSVAVIGASDNPSKIGHLLMNNIVSGGYKGKVYPINPHGGEILGYKVYKNVEEIDGDIDLVNIAIPAKFVLDVVRVCAKKGVKFANIITSGFSEVGNINEEKRIVAVANEHGMRILGPNIFGIYSAKMSLNSTFGPSDILPGNVAIITQSGALGIAMIGKTGVENIGLSNIISVGNKSDIDESDLLEYLVDDRSTDVIFIYIEGIKHGQRFVKILKDATVKKPIVILKSGRSKRGAVAAASHTGSLAGSDEVFSDIMKQCGVNRAENIQEALDWCKFLSTAPMPEGENCVIITNGGGVGVVSADACEKYGVELYDDTKEMKKIFEGTVPDFGSAKNPVDITGNGGVREYERAMTSALNSPDIHSIICIGCETEGLDFHSLMSTLLNISLDKKNKKPVVFSFFGGANIESVNDKFRKQGAPIYPDVYQAASCMGALYRNYRNIEKARRVSVENRIPKIDFDRINDVIGRVRKDNRIFLLADEAREMMDTAGIALPASTVVKNIGDAVASAKRIGYPLAMKIVSKDILHKSDAGGVALNLENEDEVVDAYQAIMDSCKHYKSDAKISGVEICEMVPKGMETIIGARTDPSFGPTIMFGLGGIYVEVMKDVSFRALPIDRSEAVKMIKEIRAYPLLLGVRGEEKKDINSVLSAIMIIGAIMENCPDISDIEINPLVVYEDGKGSKAVDARILLKKVGR